MNTMLLVEFTGLLGAMVTCTIKDVLDAVSLAWMLQLDLCMQMPHKQFEDLRVGVALNTCIPKPQNPEINLKEK